jgi:hypothetical protein
MSLDTISGKDLFVTGAAVIGAALGILNTWNTFNQRRVRLRVRPLHAFIPPHGHRSFGIQVINFSAFPVTIEEVGLLVRKHLLAKPDHLRITNPILLDEKPWPRRLEPRESVSAYFEPAGVRRPHHMHFGKAYARTSSDEIRTGDSPALRQLRRQLNNPS